MHLTHRQARTVVRAVRYSEDERGETTRGDGDMSSTESRERPEDCALNLCYLGKKKAVVLLGFGFGSLNRL